MIAISSRPAVTPQNWVTISFASTLYLSPILDLLLESIPVGWQAEIRLGLQEALVNAAKHGNNLDPSKTVVVRFAIIHNQYRWIIADEGAGFTPPCQCSFDPDACDPITEDGIFPQECGRGLFILYQIFDQVEWNAEGTELTLCKDIKNRFRLPLVR